MTNKGRRATQVLVRTGGSEDQNIDSKFLQNKVWGMKIS